MAKYLCTTSHHQPKEGGGFHVYEAGLEYEFEKQPIAHFEEIETHKSTIINLKKGGLNNGKR